MAGKASKGDKIQEGPEAVAVYGKVRLYSVADVAGIASRLGGRLVTRNSVYQWMAKGIQANGGKVVLVSANMPWGKVATAESLLAFFVALQEDPTQSDAVATEVRRTLAVWDAEAATAA